MTARRCDSHHNPIVLFAGFSFAGGNGREDGGTLGAVCEAVGGIFDIAAGEDFARGGEERRSDLKFGVRGVGTLADFTRGLDEFLTLIRSHGFLSHKWCCNIRLMVTQAYGCGSVPWQLLSI